MQQYLAPLGSWVNVIQALVFVLCVLAFSPGVIDRWRMNQEAFVTPTVDFVLETQG